MYVCMFQPVYQLKSKYETGFYAIEWRSISGPMAVVVQQMLSKDITVLRSAHHFTNATLEKSFEVLKLQPTFDLDSNIPFLELDTKAGLDDFAN